MNSTGYGKAISQDMIKLDLYGSFGASECLPVVSCRELYNALTAMNAEGLRIVWTEESGTLNVFESSFNIGNFTSDPAAVEPS